MKRYFRGRLQPLRHGNSGFTLVELLVVVGIIVALAAVIIPNVASFADRGETGAQAAEIDNVQAAMDTLLADESIIVVTANDLGTTDNGNNAWAALPLNSSAKFLDSYLRATSTTYWYCWDSTGLITEQFLAAATACTKSRHL